MATFQGPTCYVKGWTNMDVELVITVLGSILSGGVVGSFIKHWLGKRKEKAEADLAVAQSAAEVLSMYEKAIQDLQAKVESLQVEVQELKEMLQEREYRINELKSQLGSE